jgi:hypothetical protein|tara:strand:+ start:1787 stop:2014 length:228 start_codon:yes stop_codon:yes gene_type:complete
MVTNHAKNMYKMIQQIKMQPTETKKKGSGLLAPVKNFMKNNRNENDVQPSYRIARYTNTIRNKRMEMKNNGSETA